MKTIQWGIIGCGDVNEVKSGPAFNKVTNSQLVAVMRRNAEKAADYAKRHKVPNWSNDATALLEDSNINAIYVSTPPVFHLEYAQQALSNEKHVYIEKPMVLNVEQAIALRDAVKSSGKKLVVAHYRRCLPMFLKIKELINSGAIGTVKHVNLEFFQSNDLSLIAKSDENWRLNPDVSGGGLFYDIAPHQIDLMCLLFGNPLEYAGSADQKKNEYSPNQYVHGEILFENNMRFGGHWDFNSSKEDEIDSCKIVGSKGTISFSFFGNEITVESLKNEEKFYFEHPKHVQQPMIQKTVDYFLHGGENPCSVEEGLLVASIMDAFTKLS